jgi:hypothetical protein
MDELASVKSIKAAYQVNDVTFISCIGEREFIDEKYYVEDTNEWMKEEDLPDELRNMGFGPGPIFSLRVKQTSKIRVRWPTPFVALKRFESKNAKFVYVRGAGSLSVSPIIPVVDGEHPFSQVNEDTNIVSGLLPLRQVFLETTFFDAGMEGWEFKKWMPSGREAFAKIKKSPLPNRKNALYLRADGEDDDGIFFIETRIPADIEGGVSTCTVSWRFLLPSLDLINQWPRVVYIGEPLDLARQDAQHKFHWFNGLDGLISCESCGSWRGHTYRVNFKEPLEEVMICIGWKINWETSREFYIDSVSLFGK